MSNIDMFRPIKFFGYFFIVSGIVVFLFYIASLSDIEFEPVLLSVILVISIFQVILGSGVVLKRLWGFYLLKFVLNCLYIGFPLGTWIAHRTLKYIDEYNIVRYFK